MFYSFNEYIYIYRASSDKSGILMLIFKVNTEKFAQDFLTVLAYLH